MSNLNSILVYILIKVIIWDIEDSESRYRKTYRYLKKKQNLAGGSKIINNNIIN